MKTIKDLDSNKKVVLFGTGEMAKAISGNYDNIAFFIDNDERKWGTRFLDKPVYSPQALKDQDLNTFIVVVASMYYDEIADQLIDFGLKNDVHFIDGRSLYNTTGFTGVEDFIEKNRHMIEDVASTYRASSAIHKKDHIFGFCMSCVKSPADYYFNDGKKSADILTGLVKELYPVMEEKIEILEFASGYGCVTRHLLNQDLNWDVYSCDIHEEAIAFIENELKGKGVLSSTEPEDVVFDRNYHIVFCLSFFSHIPDKRWFRWLQTLYDFVLPGGYIIFTTHGYHSMKFFESAILDDKGYWFAKMSEQLDLDTDDYGQTIVSPEYVRNKIDLLPGNPEVIKAVEGFWWGHQDLWVVKKGNV